jgi:hypothetical protein
MRRSCWRGILLSIYALIAASGVEGTIYSNPTAMTIHARPSCILEDEMTIAGGTGTDAGVQRERRGR